MLRCPDWPGWEHGNLRASDVSDIGYLTLEPHNGGDIDHVVALHEAWCSGGTDPRIATDTRNLRASNASVNRGKGGRDPLEWRSTDGKTTPRKNDYPGWCNYLEIHVEVKVAYGMSMDQAEYDFVEEQLAACAAQ